MKRSSYILRSASYLLIGALFTVVACSDDETLNDQIEGSPNLAGFHTGAQSLSAVSNGEQYDFTVPVKVFGPTASELDGAVTVKISVDESSTAIEGTHYLLNTNEVTLSEDGDFLGNLPITVLTEGIDAPLAENPKLVLNIQEVTGNGRVVASAKPITLNFFYLCYSDLSGTYSVSIDHTRCKTAPYAANFPFTVTISADPDGSWHLSSADGGFLGRCTGNAGLANAGNIVELCGAIQFSDDLEYGSLDIGTITGGTWDDVTGTLTLNHKQSFSANWPSNWTSIYVRQ